ncbi:MAG: hypothetical protein ABEI86_01335, partial [Halobacteriaceae archaeon]
FFYTGSVKTGRFLDYHTLKGNRFKNGYLYIPKFTTRTGLIGTKREGSYYRSGFKNLSDIQPDKYYNKIYDTNSTMIYWDSE